MRSLILGTAGHIDHGKTALVKALTGVDTDRLKEEKERGITVDLGFAEFRPAGDLRFGIVDVPGHEGLVRNMLAGATGMDLVLLVVAADEGVMPQTREHLHVVTLLAVPRMVVAVTKSDLVDGEWLELVQEEVRELLAETPYANAPVVAVSSVTGEGLEALTRSLVSLAEETETRAAEDLVRLPVDRVFTIRGAGTVVTGTLWSGTLHVGDEVQVLPNGRDARVRTLQTHGESVSSATAGSRVAVGLAGSDVHHRLLHRGDVVVEPGRWEPSWMLTCRLRCVPGTGWALEHGQRVRLHLGTTEAMARLVLLGSDRIGEGEEGWGQLRLEEPVVARSGDRFVLRSYSPVMTIGGGTVADVQPRKRRRLEKGEKGLLAQILGGEPASRVAAAAAGAGWEGVSEPLLPQRTGLPPRESELAVEAAVQSGSAVRVGSRLFSPTIWAEARSRIVSTLEGFHEANPLRFGLPLEEVRQVPPGEFGTRIGEGTLRELQAEGTVQVERGMARLAHVRRALTTDQERLRERLTSALQEAGLAPPTLRELQEAWPEERGVEELLHWMADTGEVVALEGGFYVLADLLHEAARIVIERLGGKEDLGPADFRAVLPLTRRHLLPLLRYFDTEGITTRKDNLRSVARVLPEGWGTPPMPGQ